MGVVEQTIEIAGLPVTLRRAEAAAAPPLYLHGAPTSGAEFAPFLTRTGGIAPDLLGFGRSAKGGNLSYTLDAHAEFLAALLDALGVESVRLVAHGWGAGGGLLFAQRHPERVERLVLIDALPLLPGFAWDQLGRLLRRPLLGELAMGAASRRMLARLLRHGRDGEAGWTDAELDAVWEDFDQGTQRAILRLYRDADPGRLEAAGGGLGELSVPALVVWGEEDPWFPVRFGEAYAERLPGARLERIPGAGHWPWRERPDVVERVAAFLA